MNLKKISKIILPAGITAAGILPEISYADCATDLADCVTIPTWATFSTAWGDWFTGMLGVFQVPLFWGVGLLMAVGVVGFVLSMVISAVGAMKH